MFPRKIFDVIWCLNYSVFRFKYILNSRQSHDTSIWLTNVTTEADFPLGILRNQRNRKEFTNKPPEFSRIISWFHFKDVFEYISHAIHSNIQEYLIWSYGTFLFPKSKWNKRLGSFYLWLSIVIASNMEWIKTRNETYGEISVVNRQGNPSFAPPCPLDTQAIQALTVFRDNCRAQCNNCIIPATLTTWGEVGRVTSGWTARSWKGVAIS